MVLVVMVVVVVVVAVVVVCRELFPFIYVILFQVISHLSM